MLDALRRLAEMLSMFMTLWIPALLLVLARGLVLAPELVLRDMLQMFRDRKS